MTETTAPGGVGAREPTFSLVVPVYNVEAFLPAFLDSLAKQTHPLTDCQLIFVNDGSTDSSAALIRTWISGTGIVAEVVDQPNQGLSAARNAGLARASGTWVSFPDPDDVLDSNYLRRVREFLASRSVAPDVVSTHIVLLDDETGEVVDSHPLRGKFRGGTRLVNLESSPDSIHLSAASGFYRRDRAVGLGLRFDDSIRPNFEDASFTTQYLMASASAPRLGIVADALYLYRRRADASSLVQRSWLLEDKYTTVMERGYLALLREVANQRGSVPVWVQNLVLYDLLFYFRTDQRTHGGTALAEQAWTDRFHDLAQKILCFIDVETIDAFSVMPTSQQLRAALIVGYKRQRMVPSTLRLETLDADQRLVQIRYFCGNPRPEERIWIDGRPGQPVYAKTRDLVYLNRLLLHERILWLAATADVRVSINGLRMPLELGASSDPVYTASPHLIWRRLKKAHDMPGSPRPITPGGGSAAASLTRRMKTTVRERFPGVVGMVRRVQRLFTGARATLPPQRGTELGPFAALDPRHDAQIKRAATSRRARQRFADAWTFMDRDTQAHDNAEHLYRYVRQRHPELNAWFVLRREAADWNRLAADGFRLVAFGSAEHAQLLLNTKHLVSSQVDHYVTQPMDRSRFGEQRWRFTFLQHGVIHSDLSRWLNSKPIDRFITSSFTEHASIVGDNTPYVFTEKEVRLTGMPRHDRLLELRRDAGRPSLILVMPTWRGWLMTRAAIGNARVLKAPLATTDFWRSWSELIGSSALKAVAEGAGLKIAVVPHPNLQPHLSADDLPPWVSMHPYEQSDSQALLARAALTITDYSSQAFEAAYVECPVVYYQFDQVDFFSGSHVGRKGAWEYVADGFGPVATTRDEALDAIRDALSRDGPREPYLSRMRAAFPYRDGRCCERTIESILSLTQPATYDEGFHVQSVDGRPFGAAQTPGGDDEASAPGSEAAEPEGEVRSSQR